MPSSLFGRIKLRLLDVLLRGVRRPNRIDTEASVASSATITASRLHGAVTVGEHATLHRAFVTGPVTIGRHTSLWGPEIYVEARGDPIEIGSFCSIARHVSVHGYYHDDRRISTHYIGRNVLGRPIEDEVVSRGPVRIGHDVWIGAGVHVLSGVTIGNGAVVGAGSVVSRDVPPYAVCVGAPAEVVRHRFDADLIERLQELRWWEWSLDEIREREELFLEPLSRDLLERHA